MKDTFCPKCSTHLLLSEVIEVKSSIKCPNCKVNFKNPHFVAKRRKAFIFEGAGKTNIPKFKEVNPIPFAIIISVIIVILKFFKEDNVKQGSNNNYEYSNKFSNTTNQNSDYFLARAIVIL